MAELKDRIIPLREASSQGRLGVSLVFKLLANLHAIGKLDDDELAQVAGSLIAELDSDIERFEMWEMLEAMTPDFKRPE